MIIASRSSITRVLGFCALQVLAGTVAFAQSAPKPNLALRADYAKRIDLIGTDLRWANAALLLADEIYEKRQGQLQKPTRGLDIEATQSELNGSKAALLEGIKKVRINANRLRAISPVPRAWKRIDDHFIDAAWEWEIGVQRLETWLLHPSSEMHNDALKHLRRAQTVFDLAQRDLIEKTAPEVTAKKYFD